MLFIEYPPMAHDAYTQDFRKMGFDIEVHQILDFDEILDLKNQYRLEDFDIILIHISAGLIGGKDLMMSKEVVDKLKQAMQIAETNKSSPIRLVGVNTNLSGEKQQTQAKIFDGLFIGWDSTPEQIMECLGLV